VHRATAWRRILRARSAVLEATRLRLAADLGLDEQQVESLLRFVESRLDLHSRG
jgi:hypothetical protein